ncbi:MAG: hypothetical protein EA419_05660 [Wenzhouxiangella sp.]|nr:MAG: hypothetical protein EA419_05660 [Wenzhouxiangella sp.]
MTSTETKTLPAETRVFAIAAAVAVALLGPVSLPIPFAVQVTVLAAAVVVLGLPHGSLDPWIARRAGLYRRGAGWVGFNLAYLALAGLVLLAWWFSPGPALALFLGISAWHFSGDWDGRLAPWQRLLAATALLSMPALFHPQSVSDIFAVLSGTAGRAVAEGLRIVGMGALGGLAVVMVMAARQKQHSVFIELGALAVLAAVAPPLVYFTLYFCLLHSPRHLSSVFRQAAPEERPGLAVDATVYTLATLALAGLIAFFALPGADLGRLGLQLVFIGLAALTVPHMALMYWVERKQALGT